MELVDESEASEGGLEGRPLATVQTNGCGDGSTTPDADNSEDSNSSSSWSKDAGAASESGSDSASSPSSRYCSYQIL